MQRAQTARAKRGSLLRCAASPDTITSSTAGRRHLVTATATASHVDLGEVEEADLHEGAAGEEGSVDEETGDKEEGRPPECDRTWRRQHST